MYSSTYEQSAFIATNFDFAANCRETTNLWSVVLGIILRTFFKVVVHVLFGVEGFEDHPSCFWSLWNSASTAKHGRTVRMPDVPKEDVTGGSNSSFPQFLRSAFIVLAIIGIFYLAADSAKQEALREDPDGYRRQRVAARTYRRERCSTVPGRKGTSQRPFFLTLEPIME